MIDIIARIEALEDLLDHIENVPNSCIKNEKDEFQKEVAKLQRQLPLNICREFYDQRRRKKGFLKRCLEE